MSDASGNGQVTPSALEVIRKELPGLKIDLAKIKLHEWDKLEAKAGHEVLPWINHPTPPIWFMQGTFWLWLRRAHPQLTYEDFGELTTDDLYQAQARDDEEPPDPTDAKPEPSNSPASATSGA